MRSHLRKVLVYLFLITIFLFLATFATVSIFDSPEYARRLLVYGQSDIRDQLIFPEREIQNGNIVSMLPKIAGSLPSEVTWFDPIVKEERVEKLENLLALTHTRAFLVLKGDSLIYEGYFLGTYPDTMHTSFSAGKSFVSALIGAAVAEGKIASLDDPVIMYIPEIEGRDLNQLTVRDLLLMNSGIQYQSNREIPFFRYPFGDDALTYYTPNLRKTALRVKADGRLQERAFHYNNYHLLLEGLILERATNMSVSEYMQEKIWKPMGAEYPASWSLDSETSRFEKMESGINARAVDYARFGSVFLDEGYWNGIQILPGAWV